MTTLDQQLRDYQAQGYNVLLPSHHLQQVSALHETVLEVVPLHPDNGDVYPYDDRDLAKAKKFAIAKPGLLKLSHAAGIVWRWDATQRLDQMVSRDYVAYRAVGALRQADGTWIDLQSSYELDLEVVEQDLRNLYTKIGQALRRKNELKSEEALQAYIANNVQQELLRKRKHKLRLAETGAMLAVIRSLLAMKSLYTREEIRQPFVVPRVVFAPNLADPELRKAILASSLRALSEVYGAPTPQPAKVAIALPATEIDDQEPPGTTEPDGPEVSPVSNIAATSVTPPAVSVSSSTAPPPPANASVSSTGVIPPPAPPQVSPAAAVTVSALSSPSPTPPITTAGSVPSDSAPIPVLCSLDDFAQCPPAQIPAALRLLMERKGFNTKLLTNSKLEDWTHEQHRGFVKMLLARRDAGQPTPDTVQPQSAQPAT